MDYNNQSEQEKKDQMRKQILDELNNNSMKNDKYVDSNIQAFGQTKKKSQVNFNREVENNYESQSYEGTEGGTNKLLLLVCAVIVFAVILSFPRISKMISEYKSSQKKTTIQVEKEEEKVYEKFKLDDDVVVEAKYPIMHIDNATKTTYHSYDKVTYKDFSNNDLLYNGLAKIDERNMGTYNGNYNGTYCGGSSKKAIDARYFKLRIEHMFTKNANYKYADFKVPTNNSGTTYDGIWKYDSKSDKFIYYGDCNATSSDVLYYDIKVPYEVDSSDKNIEMYIYNYVVFATVNISNSSYTLYSDANYTNQISSGKLSTKNYETELTSVVSNLSKDSMSKYKYTFTIVDCPYQDYCFISGEWVK